MKVIFINAGYKARVLTLQGKVSNFNTVKAIFDTEKDVVLSLNNKIGERTYDIYLEEEALINKKPENDRIVSGLCFNKEETEIEEIFTGNLLITKFDVETAQDVGLTKEDVQYIIDYICDMDNPDNATDEDEVVEDKKGQNTAVIKRHSSWLAMHK